VSVVCHNALARSVREFNLKEPAGILDKTREIVIAEFQKSEEDVNDGMDISLCALNTENNELQWAGANNLLLLIREGEITELLPDKQPVGRFSAPVAFTSHTLQLQSGDQIYLFTDGYSDQFGGEAGKKLKYKKFRELLLNIYSYPAEKQLQKLGQALKDWQGKLEQVDDICVIGVKIQPVKTTS
jgi:serine phosphatase RsbU (regulator of sigma subunit)